MTVPAIFSNLYPNIAARQCIVGIVRNTHFRAVESWQKLVNLQCAIPSRYKRREQAAPFVSWRGGFHGRYRGPMTHVTIFFVRPPSGPSPRSPLRRHPGAFPDGRVAAPCAGGGWPAVPRLPGPALSGPVSVAGMSYRRPWCEQTPRWVRPSSWGDRMRPPGHKDIFMSDRCHGTPFEQPPRRRRADKAPPARARRARQFLRHGIHRNFGPVATAAVASP